ncbi:MAG: response regulator [Phaeodactylibacter sp.]|nr:response regulator [Phaeodactylibacter sp.]
MTAIIIDDETQSHKAIEQIIQHNHPDIQIVASGYSVREGVELIHTHQPDLIFLDIEMPDGSGFDLLKQSGKPDFYIIFITGHSLSIKPAAFFCQTLNLRNKLKTA